MHALAHIGVARRDPNPYAACDRDHRASDRNTAVTSFAGASAAIRTTEPPISIVSAAGGGGGVESQGAALITTGAKPVPARPTPQRSRRHR